MSEIEKKEVEETEEEVEDNFQSDETTDWKARAEELERKRREDGIRNRERTKALKAELETLKPKPQDKAEKKETNSFDYGQLAFLEARGVSEEDHDFILQEVKSTGKELKDVLKFKYVQEELKSRKEERATKTALPTSKRSSGAAKDDVDYYIQKGEMPSRADNPELYRKVRKERERIELNHRSTPPR